MNKFNIFQFHRRLIKAWLISLACQTVQLFSQDVFFEENSSFSNPPQTMWWSSENNQYDDDFSHSNDYPYSQTYYSPVPQGIREDQVQSILYPPDSNSPSEYYSIPSQNSYFNQEYRYPSYQEIPYGQQPAFFTERQSQEANFDLNDHEQNEGQNFNFPDWTTAPNENFQAEQNKWKTPENFEPESEFIYSDWDEQNLEDASNNTFSDESLSSSNEDKVQQPQKVNSDETQATSHSQTTSNAEQRVVPSLSQGKSQIKIIKKSNDVNQNDKEIVEYVVGKRHISAPAVGAIENQETSTSTINHYTVKKEVAVKKESASSHLPTLAELIAQTTPEEQAKTNPVNQQPILPATNLVNPAPSSSDSITPLLPQATQSPVPSRPPTIITPSSAATNSSNQATTAHSQSPQALKEISINFNNIAMIEYIRFISRISNKNFIFNEEELQFNVTIVSEEPTTIENMMAALLQELRIRDLALIEQGNNIIIHRNPRVRSPARIIADGTELLSSNDSELVTRVFRLNTLDPTKASEIIRPLLSEEALVEVLRDSNNLIITDLVTNVNKVAQLIGTLDAPNSGVTIGQFVVRNAFVDSLLDLANKILQPIAQGNPFILVPHAVSNSIYIVSNPFLVEKALAILQNLDTNEGKTKILSLEGLKPAYAREEEFNDGSNPNLEGTNGGPNRAFPGTKGSFNLPIPAEGPFIPPPSALEAEGQPSVMFDERSDFLPGGIGASTRWSRDLPHGHIERTLFYLYKLRYRRGDQIEAALRKIGASLQLTGTANADLVAAINSSQWIEASNALIFSGTASALDRVKELITEVDTPLRQVFIEMLILDTTITDSLSYSVDWIDRFGGGSTTGEEGFIDPTFVSGDSTANFLGGSGGIQTIIPGGGIIPGTAVSPLPVATGFLNSGGFVAGIIGTHLTHNGTRFNSIGALVRAIHTDTKANILLNPKIITEDNNTAEIFVGATDRYKTQSITNDLGTLVTNNFQFIDVGTTLRVTPLIGNNGTITIQLIQETTNPSANPNIGSAAQDFNLVEVLTKTRTVTTFLVPNGFFAIISGMIQNNDARTYSRIPCLGGIPIIGSIGKTQTNIDNKRNLMLFLRAFIIDTAEELEDITKRQQDIYLEKSKFRRAWNYEIDEGLNFLSIKPTDLDETGCNSCR